MRPSKPVLFFEVQNSKFTVEFTSGFVIRAGGLDFIVEKTNGFALAVKAYPDLPYLSVFVPGYAFVF